MSNEILSLCEAYKDYFPIGSAANCTQLKTHKELITKHFNSITPENELKFIETQPEEGRYILDPADSFVKFADENNMKLRGHTLVWHTQTPDWVFEDKYRKCASRELVLERMEAHIKNIVSRYKNKIYCWDVVNEALDDDNDIFLRPTKWLSLVGEDYIDKAFQFAHEADPNAQLFYNDYNEAFYPKRDKIYSLIKGMVERGVPIHGIGIQGHFNIYVPPVDDIRRSIEKLAELGLKIQITEMDISVFRHEDHRIDIKNPTSEMLKRQTELYEKTFNIFREYREVISGVTLWGIADDYTWLDGFPVEGRKNWPLLFDENHLPKMAFNALTYFSKCGQ